MVPGLAVNNNFFSVLHTDTSSRARLGRLVVNPNVTLETPVFMPVGTGGSVKGLWQEDLEEIGYDLILANTYHIFLRPGEKIAEMGGLKKFMSWDKHALLTDSGGYQVFSLADRVKFLPEGVEFASHLDGTKHIFTPRSVVDFQLKIGSDIMMVLDDCPAADSSDQRLRESLERTHNWAEQAVSYYRSISGERYDSGKLFGIIQGGTDSSFRRESTERIQSLPFDGIAVGGLSVGEGRESMYETLRMLAPLLDADRPRYLMGVGTIPDFLEAVRCGIDMFDCVLPTRNARNGQLLTSSGKINLRNAQYTASDEPPDPFCSCRVCRRYSLGYLRHLFLSREMLGGQMATYHNLFFYHAFMRALRHSIYENKFDEFYIKWIKIHF